ncbi:MAG: hypothetical protein NC131_17070, partial [Roseburia sp.]|nr:hypothetical protein [Roseburia sp.]
ADFPHLHTPFNHCGCFLSPPLHTPMGKPLPQTPDSAPDNPTGRKYPPRSARQKKAKQNAEMSYI